MMTEQRKKWNGDEDYRMNRNEPILEYLADDLRIVECHYGSEILESQVNMMLDCDNGKWGFTMPKTQGGLWQLFNFITTQAMFQFPSCNWAMYATRNGIRLIETSGYIFDWSNPRQVNRFTELGRLVNADMVYVGLCKRMKDFRLRISPKPSRLPEEAVADLCGPELRNNGYFSHGYLFSDDDPSEFKSRCASYHHDVSCEFESVELLY